MHRHVLLAATWLFSRLVPKVDREHLIGDLAEEYALRARADSASVAAKWYLRQICASTVPVMRLRLARAVWLASLGVALRAYVVLGVAQLTIGWALPTSYGPTYDPLGLVILVPVIVLIGYFTERSRHRAAAVLAAMMLLAVTALTLFTTENVPLWYRVALFVVGPVAALVGSALSRFPSRLSRK
jgi:uncharacterized membrane protein AbrB (regulator of aidB expression)